MAQSMTVSLRNELLVANALGLHPEFVKRFVSSVDN